MIRLNLSCLYCAFEFPREPNPYAYTTFLHLSKEVFLLISSELVLAGDQMHFYFASLVHRFEYGLKEIHQVSRLKKVSNVCVRHYDPRRTFQIGAKEIVKADSFLIFLDLDLPLYRIGDSRFWIFD